MERNVKRRLGSEGVSAVRDHELFAGVDWEAMLSMDVPVPAWPAAVPRPIWAESPARRPNFTPTAESAAMPRLRGWNYVRPSKGQC
jgi:hypothetical protein